MPKASAGAPPLERRAISRGACRGRPSRSASSTPVGTTSRRPARLPAPSPGQQAAPSRSTGQVGVDRWRDPGHDGLWRCGPSLAVCRARTKARAGGASTSTFTPAVHLLAPLGQGGPQIGRGNADACQRLVQVDVHQVAATNPISRIAWPISSIAWRPCRSKPSPSRTSSAAPTSESLTRRSMSE